MTVCLMNHLAAIEYRSKAVINENTGKTGSATAKSRTSNASPRVRLGVTDDEFVQMGRVGGMYYRQGDLEKARTVFEGLVAMDPLNSDAHSALGALLTRTMDDDQALVHLNRAIELNDKEISAYVNRAEVHISRREHDQALADYTAALKIEPNPAIYNDRGLLHLRKGDLESAIADFTEAIALDPNEEDSAANRARAMVLGIHDALEAKSVM